MQRRRHEPTSPLYSTGEQVQGRHVPITEKAFKLRLAAVRFASPSQEIQVEPEQHDRIVGPALAITGESHLIRQLALLAGLLFCELLPSNAVR